MGGGQGGLEGLERGLGGAGAFEAGANVVGPCPIAFEVTVLIDDAGAVAALAIERDLDLGGALGVGLEGPIGAHLPGQEDATGRLECEDDAPIRLAAVGGPLVPTAADKGRRRRGRGLGQGRMRFGA